MHFLVDFWPPMSDYLSLAMGDAALVKHNPEMTAAAIGALDNFAGLGLEIAPYFDPFILKSERNVLYTDYIPTDEIRAKASENPVGVGQDIPAIDFVWTPGTSLRECAPPIAFDYVVASHVMEHVPNPVGWLNELLSVTKVGGKVALFLPDRRGNADLHRPLTTFAELLELWILQPDVPSPRQIADFMGTAFANLYGADNFYEVGKARSTERAYEDWEVIHNATFSAINNNYIDVHATVWEPQHFVDLFNRLKASGLINVDISEPIGQAAEFLVVLSKLGEPARLPPNRDATRIKAVDERLRIMHEDINHIQSAIFRDLTFLITKQNEDTRELWAKMDRVQRKNRPLWRIFYDCLARVIPMPGKSTRVVHDAGSASRKPELTIYRSSGIRVAVDDNG